MEVPFPAPWSVLWPLGAQEVSELERSFPGRPQATAATPHLAPSAVWELGCSSHSAGADRADQRVTGPWPLAGRAITRHSAISCPVSPFLGLQFLLYLPRMNRDEVEELQSLPLCPLPSFPLSAAHYSPASPSVSPTFSAQVSLLSCLPRRASPFPCSVKICNSTHLSKQPFNKHSLSTGCIPENLPCAVYWLSPSPPLCWAA